MMDSLLLLVFAIIIPSGCYMAITSPETKKQRYYGWLVMTIGVLMNAAWGFYEGNILSIVLNLIAAVLDFHLFLVNKKRYKKSKMDMREKFLIEIAESRRL